MAAAEFLSRGDHLSDLFGFHSGRVGLAWVAVRLAEFFERAGDAELRRAVRDGKPPVYEEKYMAGFRELARESGDDFFATVAQVAEAAGIARPGEELAGKVRAQLRELHAADLVGVRCPE